MYKRVLVKISGKAIKKEDSKGLDFEMLNNIAIQIKELIKKEIQVSVVLGGANFWDSSDSNNSINNTTSDYMGIIATVMNSVALQDILRQHNINSVVQSDFKIDKITQEYNIQKSNEYLENDTVVIFAGGLGTTSFNTDTAAIVKSYEINSDALLIGRKSTIDVNYSKKTTSYSNIVNNTDLINDMDFLANIHMANKLNVTMVIFNILDKDSIINSALGKTKGLTIVKD